MSVAAGGTEPFGERSEPAAMGRTGLRQTPLVGFPMLPATVLGAALIVHLIERGRTPAR
ncbi:MAG: hypothetical protein KY452_11190 [Actinobacteria bacterium]|nr:hypothetical protein [Actinomycetota bacterium]